ncbi:MAG: hypothetical protein WA688_00770 [Thermoplasmata archaeon]
MELHLSSRRFVASMGAILVAPILLLSTLVAVPDSAGLVNALVGGSLLVLLAIQISGMAGLCLLVWAWITPSGRNLLHPTPAT